MKVVNEHGAIEVADVARADLTGSFDGVRVARVAGPVDDRGPARRRARQRDQGRPSRSPSATATRRSRTSRAAPPSTCSTATSARRATGSLTVDSAHGDVTVESVRGDLEVHGQHGAVHGRDVTGRAAVETTFQGVTLERSAATPGPDRARRHQARPTSRAPSTREASFDDVSSSASADRSTIDGAPRRRARRTASTRAPRVRASGDDVMLEGFRGPIDVEAERGDRAPRPAGAITAGSSVTRHPRRHRARGPGGQPLRPRGQRGPRRRSPPTTFPASARRETSAGQLAATLGGGGNAVTLSTTSR